MENWPFLFAVTAIEGGEVSQEKAARSGFLLALFSDAVSE
jgi:hypothetical protein